MLYFRGQYKRIVKGTARFFYNLSSMDVPCHRYVPTNSCFYSKRFVGYMKQNIYTTVYETNNDQKKARQPSKGNLAFRVYWTFDLGTDRP